MPLRKVPIRTVHPAAPPKEAGMLFRRAQGPDTAGIAVAQEASRPYPAAKGWSRHSATIPDVQPSNRPSGPMLRTFVLTALAALFAFSVAGDEACPCPAMAAAEDGQSDAGIVSTQPPVPCHGQGNMAGESESEHRPTLGHSHAESGSDEPCPCEHGDIVPSCCCPGCPAAQGGPVGGDSVVRAALLSNRTERLALAQASPAAGPRAPSLTPPSGDLPTRAHVVDPPDAPDPTRDLIVQHQVFRI